MRIGVVGATGQVGTVMQAILEERDFPIDDLRLFASARSAGRTLSFRGRTYRGRGRGHRGPRRASTSPSSPAVPTASRELAPRFAAAGAIVIDNSSAWRMDPDVPLVVPEVNEAALGVDPQGDRRQSQLHHHGGHAGAQAAARRRRPRPASSSRPTRRCPAPGSPGVAELDAQLRATVDGAAGPDLRRVGRRRPRRRRPSPAPSPTTSCPIAGTLVGGRFRRDQRGAEVPGREPQDPGHPGPRR